MKVLLLCLRSPFPPADGATIAMYNMASSLKKAGMQVKILSFNTRKHFIDPAKFPDDFVSDYSPELVYLDASVKVLPALLNFFNRGSYNISRFDVSLFHKTLADVLSRDKYDVIQIESLYMTPYLETIRKFSEARVIYRSHNAEYLIWSRLAVAGGNSIKNRYLRFLSERLRKYESEIITKVDGLIALTPEDKKLYVTMGRAKHITVLPIGIDTEVYRMEDVAPGPLSVVHLGSMDWLPNIEGIGWFLEKVFPLLRQKEPGIMVYLAGKKMPQQFLDKSGGSLVVNGNVDEVRSFLAGKQIMIVPLLSGGGMRVKIIEGLALGKTIISTSIGAEGIQFRDQQNILIADSPEAFCDAIIKCYRDREFAIRIGREGRRLAEDIYDNRVVGEKISEFYDSVLASGNSSIEANATKTGAAGI